MSARNGKIQFWQFHPCQHQSTNMITERSIVFDYQSISFALLSLCFITRTTESYGQFTLPGALSFQIYYPCHANVPGSTCCIVPVAFLPSSTLWLYHENEKQCSLLKSFYTCEIYPCLFSDLTLRNPLTFKQSLFPMTGMDPKGWYRSLCSWKGGIPSGHLFSISVHFFRFLWN